MVSISHRLSLDFSPDTSTPEWYLQDHRKPLSVSGNWRDLDETNDDAVTIVDLALRSIVAIVKEPEHVSMHVAISMRRITMTATVMKADMGLVIGKAGATIKAIRTMLICAVKRTSFRFELDVQSYEEAQQGKLAIDVVQ